MKRNNKIRNGDLPTIPTTREKIVIYYTHGSDMQIKKEFATYEGYITFRDYLYNVGGEIISEEKIDE